MTHERLYTTAQLARILDVPPAKVRAWARQGLIEPARRVGRLLFFDFRQLTSARALDRLRDAGVRPRTIRKAVADLSLWAPDVENAINRLEALDGGHLGIRTEDGDLAETSGQMRLDLDTHASVGETREATPSLRGREEPDTSWFERGVLAEDEGRLGDAADAYGRALALEGASAEVCFNMGNVLLALARTSEAAASFRAAVDLEADYAEAWNNLGAALSELDEPAAAVEAFACALRAAPGYADPHFNIAEPLTALDRGDEARGHLEAYVRLDPHSPWADVARATLRE